MASSSSLKWKVHERGNQSSDHWRHSAICIAKQKQKWEKGVTVKYVCSSNLSLVNLWKNLLSGRSKSFTPWHDLEEKLGYKHKSRLHPIWTQIICNKRWLTTKRQRSSSFWLLRNLSNRWIGKPAPAIQCQLRVERCQVGAKHCRGFWWEKE
jgi:hypothetical protein